MNGMEALVLIAGMLVIGMILTVLYGIFSTIYERITDMLQNRFYMKVDREFRVTIHEIEREPKMPKLHPVLFIEVARIDMYTPNFGITRSYMVQVGREGTVREYHHPTLSTRTRINKLALDIPPRDTIDLSVPQPGHDSHYP